MPPPLHTKCVRGEEREETLERALLKMNQETLLFSILNLILDSSISSRSSLSSSSSFARDDVAGIQSRRRRRRVIGGVRGDD